MPRCPNCNYPLVLLSHRMKYKCAKCSKLYPQKEIETKEFIELNKRQKEIDLKMYKQKRKEESMKSRQLKKSIKHLFNPPKSSKEHSKEYYQKNKEKLIASNRIYCKLNWERIYEKRKAQIELNRDKYLRERKEYYLMNREHILNKIKLWKLKNIDNLKINNRIRRWRTEQNKLAVGMLKKWQYRACMDNIFISIPTYSLSYLLLETQDL